MKYKLKMENFVSESKPHMTNFNEIKQAFERIEDAIIHTPLCEAKLSRYIDYNIYLKCENLQYTGSCVERGVRNVFEARREKLMDTGVIVPSTGDMAHGAAYHGHSLSIPVTVAMPGLSSLAHSRRCSELGAKVVVCGDNLEDAVHYAKKISKSSNQFLLSLDDPDMIAGLGTVGIEIISQLPETDAVIVPASNSSLLAATTVACKKLKCSCLVYGAECASVPHLSKSFRDGKPMTVAAARNLPQSLNVAGVGVNAFEVVRGNIDRLLLVDKSYIAKAVIGLLEHERLVADGAGVCALAAIMQGLVPELRGKRTVCIISSGNIDSGLLAQTIQKGLSWSGRLLRFAVAIPDQRGGLESIVKILVSENATLKFLDTEQMWIHSDVGSTWSNFVVEISNEESAKNIMDRLQHLYPSIRFTVSNTQIPSGLPVP